MYMKCVGLLEKRGVRREDIAECVLFLQKQYIEDLHVTQCLKMVDDVLHKREVQHAIITAIELDRSAEQGSMIDQDLRRLLMQDAPLYGIDEVLAYGICHLYGSIAITNFGYIDKVKPRPLPSASFFSMSTSRCTLGAPAKPSGFAGRGEAAE